MSVFSPTSHSTPLTQAAVLPQVVLKILFHTCGLHNLPCKFPLDPYLHIISKQRYIEYRKQFKDHEEEGRRARLQEDPTVTLVERNYFAAPSSVQKTI